MSNEIYGFADFPNHPNLSTILARLSHLTTLGSSRCLKIASLDSRQIFDPRTNSLVFVVGDSPESMNAEYLLDYQDYDPQSPIRLPINADERLTLLTTLFILFFHRLRLQPNCHLLDQL